MDAQNHEPEGGEGSDRRRRVWAINKHSWIRQWWHLVLCVHNDKLSRVCAACGETTVWAKLSQQWPSLLSGKPWLETKWTGTGRYTGSVTQSIIASLTQPKAPGKHNRLRLHNSNSEKQNLLLHPVILGSKSGTGGSSPGKHILKNLLVNASIIFPFDCFELYWF